MSDAPEPPREIDAITLDPIVRARLAEYAGLLASAGVERGLIGPREVPRLWSRHLLNCAVVAPLVTSGARVIDVGSGAGLPGLVWAIVRDDITLTCVEPLLRRATFLEEATAALGIGDRVQVVRARAEDLPRSGAGLRGDVVTARAVAPLVRLAKWAIPLVSPGGELLALKGQTAAEEIEEAGSTLTKLGVDSVEVIQCGEGIVDPPTIVVRARKAL